MISRKERELVAKLNRNMPEFKGNSDEVQKKIAMYLYIELGKAKVFDEKWFLGNQKERKKIEKLSKRERNNIDLLIKKRKLVCITLSALYNRLLKDFGIKSRVIQLYDNDPHCSNLIALSSGEQIVVDLQKDLDKIHTKRKTQYFGFKYSHGELTGEKLSEEELFELQKECGYVENEYDYMDTKIEELGEKIKDKEPPQILENIIQDESINNYSNNIGYIEMFKFYSSIIHKIAPQMDKTKLYCCNCYRIVPGEKENDEREYSMCMYSFYKEQIKAYLYSNKEKTFKPIDLETFSKLEKEGLFIGKNPQENGVKLLRKQMNKAIEAKIKGKYNDNYKRNSFEFQSH